MSKIRHTGWSLAACSLLWGLAPGVHADAARQSLQSIRAAAEAFVRLQIPGDQNTVRVSAAELDQRLRLAQCSGPLRASLTSGAQLQARTAVGVSCREGASWTVYVPVTVQSQIAVLVLREPAARGSRVSARDVDVQQRLVTGFASTYITDASALAGRTLKRTLPSGTALTADVLVPDFVVRRGEQVTMLATTGRFEVRAPGLALSDGRDGAHIRVQNLSSRKVVEGIVEGPGVIRVSP